MDTESKKRERPPWPDDGRGILKSLKEDFYKATTECTSNGMLAATPKLFFTDYDAQAHGVDGALSIRYFLKKDEARDYAFHAGRLPMWSIDKYCGDKAAKFFAVGCYDAIWESYSRCERPAYGSPTFAPDKAWREYDNVGAPNSSSSSASIEDCEALRNKWLRQAFHVQPFMYEVIMEGKPLHLYLDMEGSKVTNPDVDFNALSVKIITELQAFMCNMGLGVPNSAIMNAELLILDSSTAKKFSKHVLFKIPGAVFADNYICGALMRNFHVHLIRRFGPEATNQFYINPFADAKDSQRVSMLDFAVYTKFRDFRLIGSCKRRGCSDPKTQLRWLWVQGKRKQLTKELFDECLIQNVGQQAWPHTWTIAAVYDTINGGVPSSSSLRTVVPLGPTHKHRSTMTLGANGELVRRSSLQSDYFERAGRPHLKIPARLEGNIRKIGDEVTTWLARTKEEPFRRYVGQGNTKLKLIQLRDGNWAWAIDTESLWCTLKNGNHKSRTATFLVWITGLTENGYDERKVGSIKQQCIANSCTDGLGPSNSKRSTWLGNGLPKATKTRLIAVMREAIDVQLKELGLGYVGAFEPGPEECLFDDNE